MSALLMCMQMCMQMPVLRRREKGYNDKETQTKKKDGHNDMVDFGGRRRRTGASLPVRAAVLRAPEGFLAGGVKNKVVLSWEPVKRADCYEIWEKEETEGTGTWKRVRRTAKRKVVLKRKNRGGRYCYKVRACGGPGSRLRGKYSKKQRVSLAKKGESTLGNFLNIALAPVGSTMYIWGGGWNRADTGAGADGRRIGLNPGWRAFAGRQKSSYDYRSHRYQRGRGLDCSGFVGWVVYNTFHTKNGKEGDGYVRKSSEQAKFFEAKGWGRWKPAFAVTDYRPGDIMSGPGHVYIVLGQCEDGSIVLVHSSPAGVQVCGTVTPSGNASSEAVRLAGNYMKKHHPFWHKRFPDCSRDSSYLNRYSQFRWNVGPGEKLEDVDGLAEKGAADVLKKIGKAP
ncbi:MAG: hypothetical protein Q4D60_04275 [Eubacteriales bacterium]|nr:hypothetical protein [Eubacteriales bacterium]